MNPSEFRHISEHQENLWWFRGMRRIVDLLLDSHCPGPAGARVLEAGCGTGFDAQGIAARRGWNITPVDLSLVAAAHARRRGLHPALSDIRALPFAGASFQGLISLDVLVHLEPAAQQAAIAEFARVLAPGGWLLLRTAALEILRSRHSGWVGERSRTRIPFLRAAVESAGLRIRRATYANSLLLPVALVKFRVWEPLAGAPPASGVALPAPWLNRLLELPLRAESAWLRFGGSLPLGQSAIVVAEKPL